MLRVLVVFACCLPLAAIRATAQEIGDASLNPLSSMTDGADGAFVARPLFVPSRRPPASPPQSTTDQQPVAAAPPELRLLGVIQAQDQRIAQVLMASDQARYSLRVGDYLGGWRVSDITLRSVTLSFEGDERRFELGAGN